MIKITPFKGLKPLINRLENANKDLTSVESLIAKEAEVMKRNSSVLAPYKNGRLSKSISTINVNRGENKGYRVYTKVNYASFQDFGTGSKFSQRPANYHEFDDYATNFRGLHKADPEVRPRAYFMSQFILSRRNLNREYTKLLNKFKFKGVR